ncbi:MAG: hypothetical protein AAFN42_09670 [Cyanobacteria bacterium J06554_1]
MGTTNSAQRFLPGKKLPHPSFLTERIGTLPNHLQDAIDEELQMVLYI